jgi:predicted  nucleic acid-binding Zn-ribbon protein
MTEHIRTDNSAVIEQLTNELAEAKRRFHNYVDKYPPKVHRISYESADGTNYMLNVISSGIALDGIHVHVEPLQIMVDDQLAAAKDRVAKLTESLLELREEVVQFEAETVALIKPLEDELAAAKERIAILETRNNFLSAAHKDVCERLLAAEKALNGVGLGMERNVSDEASV